MKATHDIPAGILDNAAAFTADFYRRFKLRHAPHPIRLTDQISKNYQFPTFYGDVTCAQAIFHCPYEKAAALVSEQLHPLVRPVRMPKGRALVAFSCYEYRQVMGVPPYNEIAVAIPVMVNARWNPPVLPMVPGGFSHFGYYIAAMPVTSHENTLRGNNIWGLPKVTRDIDIFREGNDCVTVAYEPDGTEYLRLTVPTGGTPTRFDVSSYLYTRREGVLYRSETNFRADFMVTKFMNQLFKKCEKPARPWLSIGASPSAEVLRTLEIEEHPFQFRYAEHMESCFDLADQNPPSWLSQLNRK